MANRRMFSNRIANSAKFLQMPAESQALYFHLILRADDDGIVECYPVIKMLGVASDNFKVLQAKGFIKQLNEDQVVVITDWLEHNLIRADRKVDSIYKHLLLEQAPEIKTIEPKPRSDVEDNSARIGGQSTDGLSQVRLGKVKIDTESNQVAEIIDLFQVINPSYQQLFGNKTERSAVSRLLKQYGFDDLSAKINALPEVLSRPYAPRISTPYQLEKKMGELMQFVGQEKAKVESKKPKITYA